MWEPHCPTHFKVDASSYATGGILLQKLDDNLWHLVAFWSQLMADAERNCEIYNKKMLTIICTLKDWQHYLKGLPQSFNIISDYRNLQYWHTTQNLSHRQAYWLLYLNWFDFSLTHKPRTTNTQADPLSYIPIPIITDANNNQDQIVLKPTHFLSTATLAAGDLDTLKEDICTATELNPQVLLALQTLHNHVPCQLFSNLAN